MPDLWLTCDHFVGSVCYGSTNQTNSAFHPFKVGKWVVIHELRGWRPELCMAVWSQVKVPWPRPIGCTPTLSVTQQRRCSCSLWRYISVMPLRVIKTSHKQQTKIVKFYGRDNWLTFYITQHLWFSRSDVSSSETRATIISIARCSLVVER